jgi:hypothetical protein
VVASGNGARRTELAQSALKTQEYLDAIWIASGS